MDRAAHRAKMKEICEGYEFRTRGSGYRLKEEHILPGRALFNLLASKGILNGKTVLEIAKDPRGAGARLGIDLSGYDVAFLRGYPTWDDEMAGEEWRIQQMSDLIRNMVMVTKDGAGNEIVVPAFPGVRGEDGAFTRYSAEDAAQAAAHGNPQPQEDILVQAIEELESFIRKHLAIEKLQGLCRDVQALVDKHRPRPQRTKAPPKRSKK